MKNILRLLFILVGIIFIVRGDGYVAMASDQVKWSPDRIEAFVDGMMASRITSKGATAATISIVKGGKILLAKGYGHANLEKNQMVDPAKSLFRIGSVTKLFAYTSIMQLYDKGLIDLDRDVNDYLKGFQIPSAFEVPITIRHLMTHSAGFEDSALGGYMDRSATEARPLVESLNLFKPKRMWAPGQYVAYSNYGVTILGRVVESISGLDFFSYVEQNIFTPLGMTHSSVRESDDQAFLEKIVTAYKTQEGEKVAKGFEYIGSWAPAGSMSSSAEDMAKFMMAHLAGGEGQNGRIFSEDTARLMHSRAFSRSDDLANMAHGFYEVEKNGIRAISHGGATSNFFSNLFLLPDQDVGIFYSFTGGSSGSGIKEPFINFMDYFYPRQDSTPVKIIPTDLSSYVGSFRSLRMAYTDPLKVFYLADEVTLSSSEGIHLVMERNRQSQIFYPIGQGLFEEVEDGQKLYFIKGENGSFDHMQWGEKPYYNFYRLNWYETPDFNMALVVISLSIFLSILVKSYYGWPHSASGPAEGRGARHMLTGSCIAALGIFTLLALSLMAGVENVEYDDISSFTNTVAIIALCLLPICLLCLYFMMTVWREGFWTVRHRLHYSAAVVALMSIIWFCSYWNLIGF